MANATGTKTLEEAKSSKLEKAIVILCFLLIAAHFISSFFPEERLWGINHLAYFPLPYRILLSLLAFLIFIPKVNPKVQGILDKALDFSGETKKVVAFLLLCGVSLFLFWLLRTKTHFLGDGYTWISYLESNAPLIKWSEPLEILFHLYSYQFLNLFFKVPAESIYTILSYLSGIAFVSVLLFFSEKLGKTSFERFLIFSLVMLLGGSQLFFGYAEHYSWVYVAVFSYLVFSLRFLEGKVSILAPFLAFLLCAGFHFSAFYLFPSLIFLFAQGLRTKRIGRWTIGLLSAALLGATAFQFSKGGGRLVDVFVPLFQGRPYAPGYTLFSLSHVLDLINEQLLLSPFGLILLLAIVLFARGIMKLKDSIILFLVIVTTSQLAYNFLIDPKFGAPRDWDLFSATALGYSLLAVYLLIKHSKAIFNFRYTVLILISTTFFSTLPWILLNADTDKSIHRFRTILDLDPKRSRTGHYTLAKYFLDLGMIEEVVKEGKKQTELFPEGNLVEAAVALLDQERTDEAISVLKRAIEKNPFYAPAYHGLGRAYTSKGLYNDAIDMIKRAIELNPYKASCYESLGLVYYLMGRVDESIQTYKKAGKLNPEDPSIYFYLLAASYAQKGSLGEAVEYCKKSLQANPNFADGHCDLGNLYLRMNRIDEAVFSFEKALELQPDHAQAHYGLGVALDRKGLAQEAAKHLEQYLNLSTDTADHRRAKSLLENLKGR